MAVIEHLKTNYPKILQNKNRITEKENSIRFNLSKGKSKLERSFLFDEKGICNNETIITYCDTCLSKRVSEILQLQQYGWKKINENQYVSTFTEHLMLELPPENKDFSLSILWVDWTETLYNFLLKQ